MVILRTGELFSLEKVVSMQRSPFFPDLPIVLRMTHPFSLIFSLLLAVISMPALSQLPLTELTSFEPSDESLAYIPRFTMSFPFARGGFLRDKKL